MLLFDVVTCMGIIEWTGQLAVGVCVCVSGDGGEGGLEGYPAAQSIRKRGEGGWKRWR